MSERQCPAGLIIYSGQVGNVQSELRCELSAGHEHAHLDGQIGWTADE